MLQVNRVLAGLCIGFGLGLAALTIACSGSGGGGGSNLPAVQAPSGLTYSANPAVYTKGIAIPANTPASSGGAVTSYAVTPALPAGLALNTTSGVISGTPVALATSATYAVTATNGGGSATVALNLTVNDAAPSGLAYGAAAATYTKGVPIAPNMPSNTGGAIVAYAIAPALPSGLALNPATGVITGTPNAVAGTNTYTVTGTNTGGSATAALTLTVNDIPPTALAYGTPAATYLRGMPIAPNFPSISGGAVTLFTVAPPLPAGLALNPATGVISGTPTALTGVATFTVTASNSGGSTSVDISIRIIEAPPENLVYSVNPATYTKGAAITPNTPSNGGGGISAYAVVPALPAGITLNPVTGVISGTPSALAPAASYVITGSNPTGSTTAVLVLTVNDAPPVGLTYSSNPAAYTKGLTISPNVPANGGGAISAYSVAPALPAGLTLNPVTGIITGTPTVLAPAGVYTVTGTGPTGGTTTAALTLTVKDVAPSITYGSSSFTFTTGVPVNLNPTNTGGPAVTWSLTPSLPAGLAFDSTNGAITGIPSTITPPAMYTVTATNTGGTSSVSPTLRVNPPAPLITAQPVSRTVYRGQTASFSVSATGTGTLSIQWRRGGTAIPGATTSTYAMPATVLADNNAVFSAVVSDTYGGSVTSSNAILTVKSGFTTTGSIAEPRTFHGAALLPSGKVLIAGGFNVVTGERLRGTELFDPATGTFSPSGPVSEGRIWFTTTKLTSGKVLLVGGQTPPSPISAELYDSASGTFSSTGPLNIDRDRHTATLLADGKVLIAGGTDAQYAAPPATLNSAEVYDPATGRFTMTGSMITGRMQAESILLPNGKVLVSGGFDLNNNYSSFAEIYDPATGTWSASATPQIPRVNHKLALRPDGKVLVVGGMNPADVFTTEIFDPASNSFSDSGPLNLRSSSGFRLFVLPSGKILRTGGFTGDFSDDPRSDLYNPATGTWTLDAPLNFLRQGHSGTTLPGGRFLIVGGSRPVNVQPQLTAEMYE